MWVVEAHEVPLVQVNLVVMAGSGDDPAGQFGVGQPDGGDAGRRRGHPRARSRSPTPRSSWARTSPPRASFDASAVRLNVPVRRLAEALPLMADVALRPTFPAAELDRLRQERLTAILQARDDAAAVIGPAFAQVVFGKTHRYGTGANGTTRDAEGVHAGSSSRRSTRRSISPGNATLIVVGDVTDGRA